MISYVDDLLDNYPLSVECYVDNKGTVDAVHSTRTVNDKLTRLTIAAIREHLLKKEVVAVRHIAGVHMIADPLTKHGAPTDFLLEVPRTGCIPDGSLNLEK